MDPLAQLSPFLAHGGVGGAIAEALIALLVLALFVAAFVRERGRSE